LTDSAYDDIAWRAIAPAGLPALVADQIAPRFRAYLEAPSPQQAFAAFESFRVLCALREGPFGVEAINRLIEQELTRLRWIRPEERWYAGRPLIMTRNDYGLRLFNGDIGLIWPDAESGGALRAVFAGGDGTVRKLQPSRLPEHETVYAMTVHKSQGSEFDDVLLLLPDQPSPVVTRELIYTGLTRARARVLICGNRPAFADAVARTVERSSGLADRLAARGAPEQCTETLG
jgi:exodeoxyribonuclease V alpha subunit